MKRTAPLWITIVCVAFGVCSLAFTVFAYTTNYQVALPVLGDLTFVPPDLSIDSISFRYNSTLRQYMDALVEVRNSAGVKHTGKVEIFLYTIGDIQIASGIANTGDITGGGANSVTVPLTWQSGYTVANCSRGDIQVQQLT